MITFLEWPEQGHHTFIPHNLFTNFHKWAISVAYYSYTNTKHSTYPKQADSVVQVRTHLITFLTSVIRHEEKKTQFLQWWPYYLTPPMRCLRSLSVEIRKTQLHLQWSKFNSQLPTQWQELNFLPAWSNVNLQLTCFLKSSNSQPIFSGHDVIPIPAPFTVWGLLWQWWLSYPLRTSVRLFPTTVHLN